MLKILLRCQSLPISGLHKVRSLLYLSLKFHLLHPKRFCIEP